MERYCILCDPGHRYRTRGHSRTFFLPRRSELLVRLGIGLFYASLNSPAIPCVRKCYDENLGNGLADDEYTQEDDRQGDDREDVHGFTENKLNESQ